MRLGIRTKQVLGVTAVVGLAAAVLFGWYLATLARILLEGSRSRAESLSNAAYQRAFALVERGGDVNASIGADDGLRTILQTAAYGEGLVYAAIVDPAGVIIADDGFLGVGTPLDPVPSLDELVDRQSPWLQLRAIYATGGKTLEVRKPLVVGTTALGTIRVGVSTLLIRDELGKHLFTPILTAAVVLGVALLLAMLLAQVVLKPIHVIRGGLAKLGRGELDVNVELPADAELRELGTSFTQVSARIAADRTALAGQRALKSIVDRLEDAVAMFSKDGVLLFANPAMRETFQPSARATEPGPGPGAATAGELWVEDHPYRAAVALALAGDAQQDSPRVHVPGAGEQLVLTHVVPGSSGEPMGVLLVARDLAYLSQVESSLRYSDKLAALGRLTSGIAHEIKNPLNATMIHLELLRMEVQHLPPAVEHVKTIVAQIRRLDEVVQGFMKFARPENLKLQSVELSDVFDRLRPLLDAEAGTHHVQLHVDVPADLPTVEGDPNLLEQAFLNLALNAYQAMPDGGRIDIVAREGAGRMVVVEVRDTGVGIPPEHLSRIFDLYFTTKSSGSGIGLSLVFRTIQLHDGEIEVESTPGRGTTFRVMLRQAPRMFQGLGR
jgi:signal transduction histidine kinase